MANFLSAISEGRLDDAFNSLELTEIIGLNGETRVEHWTDLIQDPAQREGFLELVQSELQKESLWENSDQYDVFDFCVGNNQ